MSAPENLLEKEVINPPMSVSHQALIEYHPIFHLLPDVLSLRLRIYTFIQSCIQFTELGFWPATETPSSQIEFGVDFAHNRR